LSARYVEGVEQTMQVFSAISDAAMQRLSDGSTPSLRSNMEGTGSLENLHVDATGLVLELEEENRLDGEVVGLGTPPVKAVYC
jgi:hypothetical protein